MTINAMLQNQCAIRPYSKSNLKWNKLVWCYKIFVCVYTFYFAHQVRF